MKATVTQAMSEIGAMLLRGEDDHAPDAFLAAMVDGVLERYTVVQRRNVLTYMLHHETTVPVFERLLDSHPKTMKVISRAYTYAWMLKLDMPEDAAALMAADIDALPNVR